MEQLHNELIENFIFLLELKESADLIMRLKSMSSEELKNTDKRVFFPFLEMRKKLKTEKEKEKEKEIKEV